MNDSKILSYHEAFGQMDAAVELAREGKTSEAINAALVILQQFPNDTNMIHKMGMVYYLSAQQHQALGYFHRALEISPEFPYAMIALGDIHNDLGELDRANQWYQRAAGADPTNTTAHLRAALTSQTLGHPAVALRLLAASQLNDPNGFEINRELARALVFHNRRSEAVEHYARAVAAQPTDETVRIEYFTTLNETGQYERLLVEGREGYPCGSEQFQHVLSLLQAHARLALNFDHAAIIRSASTRESGTSMLSPSDVLSLIKRAVEAHRPFSLTRHGDGEGRFLILSDASADLGLSIDDVAIIGESIWWNWFGEGLARVDREAIKCLRQEYVEAISQSDIVGMPLVSRYKADFQQFGYLAVLEDQVTAIVRNSPQIKFCDSLVNVGLHSLSPFYRDILTGLPFLGVIGPHEDLSRRLGSHLGITNHKNYLIPGEMRLPNQQRRDEADRHFPLRFREVLANIEVPYQGAVFIVAAGLLGKIYCNRIKSLGGIALDVGSIADAWLGYNTRPGQYDDVSFWRLPPNEGIEF